MEGEKGLKRCKNKREEKGKKRSRRREISKYKKDVRKEGRIGMKETKDNNQSKKKMGEAGG